MDRPLLRQPAVRQEDLPGAGWAEHGRGILLLHARTETATWRESIYPYASRILLLRHRQRFYRPDGSQAAHNSGAPVALIAYGDEDAEILAHCGLPGTLSPRGRWESSPPPATAGPDDGDGGQVA